MRRIFSLCFVLIALGTAFGQECRVTTAVRFVNEHAEPISNITADQLKPEVGGKPAKIVGISPGVKPEIILLIDASSSNKGTWSEIVASARQFAADATNGIAAVVFRDRILAISNGASDTKKLLDQLPMLTPRPGGTALYETLVDVAGRTKNHDAALVVIGDGEDNMSRYSSDQVVSMFLRSSWPPVFGLILDYDREETRRGYFHKIALETGGLTIVPANASKVAEAETALAADLFGSFRVTLVASQPITKPVKLKIELIGPKHGMHVAHAAEVTACDSSVSAPETSLNP